jgi:hypothetical protein
MLKPYLTEKLNQSFPDPSAFTKEEEFTYAAKTASVFKKVCAEILMWVEGHEKQVEHLEKKQNGEITSSFRLTD